MESSDTIEIRLDRPPAVIFTPGVLYRGAGYVAAALVAAPALASLVIAPFVAVPLFVLAGVIVHGVRNERTWVGPEGISLRRQPLLRDHFVAWERIDEVALPVGALRSPWLRVDGTTRVRLPLFVESQAFADAVGVHCPDALDRTCEWILHTRHPRGRWIEGVWICDAHRKKWCGPCNEPVPSH
jgi:hypothetical protein